MNAYNVHADALRALQNELGGDCPAIWFNGQLIRVLPGSVKFKRENSPGGFMLEADLKFTCLVADFGDTLPDSNDNFNFPGQGGREFLIISVATSPLTLHLDIEANFANQDL